MNTKKNFDWLLVLGILTFISLMSTFIVYGDQNGGPTGASSATVEDTQTLNISKYSPTLIKAQAGNVSRLTLTGVSVTQAWQGFYGNVTGTITLDDMQNWTFYDWQIAEPQGEIYAANATISNWETVHCFNYSNNGTEYTYSYDGGAKTTTTFIALNLTEIEKSYNITPNDYDGVDETFNETGKVIGGIAHNTFYVGQIQITNGTCPATSTYINDARNTDADFQNVMLTVNNTETIIFTTIIEEKQSDNRSNHQGFNNASHDFQILVLDDGHLGNEVSTSYYFYVELE